MSYLKLLDSELEKFEISIPQQQKIALSTYCDELARWNGRMNLTALSGAPLVRRLVAEPIWIAQQLQPAGDLIDIGSGNGCPAIPFQIRDPDLSCQLIEARAKRAAFLRHIVGILELRAVVRRARFEDIAQEIGRADWITLQAVNLTTTLMDSMRAITRTTTVIVWITSLASQPPVQPFRKLTVPVTGTQVFLFHMDLS